MNALEVRNVSKRYRIGARKPYLTIREELKNALLFRRRNRADSFWALKDVSFDLAQGESLGIVGRNGAGKSTLLKTICRITSLTEGEIQLRGRIGSLLEVGTGFHPELTGRENVYLNGTILGMTRKEVQRKFDDIVAFAGVERFLDTPVKRFSSGMYVRLAFAVAAHLEPEVLVVDEVLAVGDAEFQRRCLQKMKEVATGGRTVLFVSHNMSAIQALCTKCLYLKSGQVGLYGTVNEAVSAYHGDRDSGASDGRVGDRTDRQGNGWVTADRMWCEDGAGRSVGSLQSGRPCVIAVELKNNRGTPTSNTAVSFEIWDEWGARLALLTNTFEGKEFAVPAHGATVRCEIGSLPLARGGYQIHVHLAEEDREVLDYVQDALSIEVVGGDFFGTGSEGRPTHCRYLLRSKWDISEDAQGCGDEQSLATDSRQ